MTNQRETTSRPLIWEDDPPAASRFRRVQQGVPRTGRALPGMPLDMDDADDEDLPRSKWGNNGGRGGHWYWPTGKVGRVLVGIGIMVVLALILTGAAVSKTYLQHDARFRIAGASHIQAVGLTEVTRAQMLPVFGEDIGRNVFFVPLNERRKELEEIPWIQQATVMRLLPDQIRVDIVERKPVAFTRHGQQIGLVDASGVLLDMTPAAMAAHRYSFPVLTGINAGDKPASRQARMAVYQRMMSELDGNGQRNSEQLSEIDLTDPEDARVLMPEQGTDILAHFGEDHFLERYQRYKEHIAEWRQQYPALSEVDLRYEHQVVLDMASGATHAQPNPGEETAKAKPDVKPAKAATSTEKLKPQAKSVSANPSSSKADAKKPIANKPAAVKPGNEKPNALKPGAGKTSTNKTSSAKTPSADSSASSPSTAKTGAKKPLTSSAKSKTNATKSKDAKAAANKKHALGKPSTPAKTSSTKKNATQTKAISKSSPKPKPVSAARTSAAEGQ